MDDSWAKATESAFRRLLYWRLRQQAPQVVGKPFGLSPMIEILGYQGIGDTMPVSRL